MPKDMFNNIHGNIFETPDWLFCVFNDEFNFQWDLACDINNSKCKNKLNCENYDSLKEDWHRLSDGWLWLNPPYSPLKPWIVKAQKENKKGAKIVILCPPIISTKYFAQWLPSEIRFIVGRLPFIKDGIEMKSNTNDSCLLIYDVNVRQPNVVYVNRDDLKGKVKPSYSMS